MAKNDGGPASPQFDRVEACSRCNKETTAYPEPGMSLRDWFAGHALVGMTRETPFWDVPDQERRVRIAVASVHAYEIADAMLAAREKEQGDE